MHQKMLMILSYPAPVMARDTSLQLYLYAKKHLFYVLYISIVFIAIYQYEFSELRLCVKSLTEPIINFNIEDGGTQRLVTAGNKRDRTELSSCQFIYSIIVFSKENQIHSHI